MSSRPQDPQNFNVQNPAQQSKLGSILFEIHRYTDLAAQAVLQAQHEGIGQDGASKAQIALSIVHTGLQTAGLVVPGVSAAAQAERQLEPIFIPLFTALVNAFRAHGHPAFTQPPASANPPAPASGQ